MLLFPGIFFHELSHYVMCKLLRVKVTKFSVSMDSGFVEHKVPKSIIKSFFIGIAPSIFGIICAVILLNLVFDSIYLEFLKFYLAFVILYTSNPSKADSSFHKYHSFWKKILASPLLLLFRIYYYASKNTHTRLFYSMLVIFLTLMARALWELRIS